MTQSLVFDGTWQGVPWSSPGSKDIYISEMCLIRALGPTSFHYAVILDIMNQLPAREPLPILSACSPEGPVPAPAL